MKVLLDMTAYRNTLVTVCLRLLCVTVIGIAAGSAHAATVQYTMFIDSAGPGTWEVRAEASLGDNWGLQLVSVPLLNVDFPVTLVTPFLTYLDLNDTTVKTEGMDFFTVDDPSPIGASQDITKPSLLVYGFGQTAGTLTLPPNSNFITDRNANYDASLLVATGTYNELGPALAFGDVLDASANVFPDAVGGNPVAATVEFSTVQVPEPGTSVLATFSLLSIWIAGRRNIRRDRQAAC